MAIDGWTELCLGEILCSKNDKSKQVKSSEYQPIGLYPIVDQSSDFICGYCDDSKKVINNELPYTIFGDHTRHTKFVNFPFVVGADGTQIIKPIQSVDDRFFFYLVSDAANKIGNYGYDRHFKHLREFRCIFPIDKKEQTQIAEVLSTIDRAIAQTEAIIAKQQRIKTGLMQDLLTKGVDENGNIRSEATHKFKDSAIGRIPVEWEVKELREVSLIIDPNPSHRYPPSSDIGVPIASTENFVGDNDFDLSVSEKVPFYVFEQQNQRCKFSQTDVVFARKGRLGFARYYGESEKVFSHTVVIFKKRDEQLLESHYLLWLVRFRDFFDQLDKQMNSNSGVPTLGVQFLGSVPVRIPKLSEQIQICSTLDSLEMRIEEEKRSLSKQKRQKTGLMQALLTGKVRVTSLNKE